MWNLTTQCGSHINLPLAQVATNNTLDTPSLERRKEKKSILKTSSLSPKHNTICALTLETVVPFDKMQMSSAVSFFLFLSRSYPQPIPRLPIPWLPQWALTAGGLKALQAACVGVAPRCSEAPSTPVDTEDAPTQRQCRGKLNFFHNTLWSHFMNTRSHTDRASISQSHPDGPRSDTERQRGGQQWHLSQYFSASVNVALLWGFFLKPDQSPPAKLDEIGPFEPQRMTGIFGALVSNDRAAEWVEGEWSG